MTDFKKNDLIVVQEDGVVIKGCINEEGETASLRIGEGPIGYPQKSIVIQAIKQKDYTPLFHKKGSVFTCEEYILKPVNDMDRKLVRIEGIYYYAGFFKLLDKNVKRRSIFENNKS